MKYFVTETKRKASNSTCFFEFQKGYYHDQYWLQDSINISDDLWDEFNLSELIGNVNKDFNYYGITVITKNQWNKIINNSQKTDSAWKDVIAEAIPWVNDCFEKNEVFSIIGM